jgi:hypothetical protein
MTAPRFSVPDCTRPSLSAASLAGPPTIEAPTPTTRGAACLAKLPAVPACQIRARQDSQNVGNGGVEAISLAVPPRLLLT